MAPNSSALPHNPLTHRRARRPGLHISQIFYVAALRKLRAAYSEIAALTDEELTEIKTDPVLTRTYEEYCAYWRAVQAFIDRSPDPERATDAERRTIVDEYSALKLSNEN